MVALGKRIVAGVSYGAVIGSILYVLFESCKTVVGLSALGGPIGFIIGMGSAIGMAFAQDMKEGQ